MTKRLKRAFRSEAPKTGSLLSEADWSDIMMTPKMILGGRRSEGLSGLSSAHAWGESFSELGPYQEGQGSKHLHWPSYLNRGELNIKRFDLPQRSQLWLFLDATASMATGNYWGYAERLCAHLTIAAIRGGLSVHLLIDHNGTLLECPPLHQILDLPKRWRGLIPLPHGESSSPEQRRAMLSRLPSSASLICVSDGIVTSQISELNEDNSHDRYKTQRNSQWLNERVLNSAEQLHGAIGRLERVIYLCLIDEDAERPPIDRSLRSPEGLSRKAPLSQSSVIEAEERIKAHRRLEAERLESFERCTWLDLKTQHSPIEAYLEIQRRLL